MVYELVPLFNWLYVILWPSGIPLVLLSSVYYKIAFHLSFVSLILFVLHYPFVKKQTNNNQEKKVILPASLLCL